MKTLLNKKVLLVPIPSNRTEGGIILLDQSYERPQLGVVNAFDPDIEDFFAKEGDVVSYPKGNGKEVIIDGQKFVLISHQALLASGSPAHKINHRYIMIEIDKQLQRQKRETIGELETPDGKITLYSAQQFNYMTKNLQIGPVIQIGKAAQENMPEMEVGDLVIFHHTIEEDKWRLMERKDNGNELRLIDGSNENHNYELMGIIQDDGTVYPSEPFIYLEPFFERFNRTTSSTLDIYDEMTEQALRDKLVQLDMEIQKLKANFDNPDLKFKKGQDPTTQQMDKADQITKAMFSLQNEQAEITGHLNRRKLIAIRVMYVHPKTTEHLNIEPGQLLLCEKDILYPLDVMGSKFLLLNKDHVIAKINEAV